MAAAVTAAARNVQTQDQPDHEDPADGCAEVIRHAVQRAARHDRVDHQADQQRADGKQELVEPVTGQACGDNDRVPARIGSMTRTSK